LVAPNAEKGRVIGTTSNAITNAVFAKAPISHDPTALTRTVGTDLRPNGHKKRRGR
jgi:hypothetical protein